MEKLTKKINSGFLSSFFYIFSSLFTKGIALITTPIFTRIMSTEDVGIVNLFSSWFSIISTVSTLSLTSGGYMVSLKEFRDNRNQYDSSVLTLATLASGVIAVLYFCFSNFFSVLMGLSFPLCCLMLYGLIVSPAMDFWLARQRYEYKYKAATVISILSALVSSIVAVLGVLIAKKNGFEKLGAIRLFCGNGAAYFFSTILFVVIFVKGKTTYNKSYWSSSLKLSIPLIVNSLATQVLSVSDRTMISRMVGNSAVGIYSLLYTVSSLSLIVWSAINTSFVPYLFENIDSQEHRENIRNYSTQLLIVFSGIAILLTLSAPEIVSILGTDEYYEAIYIMPPIAAGVYFTAISGFYSNILIYYKKTSCVMISSVIAAVLNVILNFICIKYYGYMSAAYTTLVAYMVMAIIQAIVETFIFKKINATNNIYSNKHFFCISLVTTVSCLLCLYIYQYFIARYILLLIILVAGIIYAKKCINSLRRNNDDFSNRG